MEMDLSECQNLAEILDLSKATNLKSLKLNYCECLVMLPSTIGNLQKLELLEMQECTALEVLPIGVNLSSLEIVNLNGCTRLRSFPQISRSIKELYLNDTATEEVPCCIENFSRLAVDAQELILRSYFKPTLLPGGDVPMYSPIELLEIT